MKLSFWTIIIMAISIAVGVLAFGFFHQYQPTMTAAKYYTEYKAQLDTEAAKANAAKGRVTKAQAAVRVKDAAWQRYVATRTPEPGVERGGISLAVNPYQLTVDTLKFRDSIQRAVNNQVKRGGVKVVQAPFVQSLTADELPKDVLTNFYNYPGIRFPVVIFDFGTVTVSGTYAQILANVRSYKSMPHYLAVADGLSLSGTSPNLTGTYNLSIVGFIRGKQIFPPEATAATVPGGAPGGARGAPGAPGFPGAPPGFPGRPGGGDER